MKSEYLSGQASSSSSELGKSVENCAAVRGPSGHSVRRSLRISSSPTLAWIHALISSRQCSHLIRRLSKTLNASRHR
jgi:hypothetical protein